MPHDLGMIARIPKTIRDDLGDPTKIKFLKRNGKILVKFSND